MLDYAGEHHIVKQVQNKRLGFCRLPRDGVLGANLRLCDLRELSKVDFDQAAGESIDAGTRRRIASTSENRPLAMALSGAGFEGDVATVGTGVGVEVGVDVPSGASEPRICGRTGGGESGSGIEPLSGSPNGGSDDSSICRTTYAPPPAVLIV